ncbi:MAG: hypothetical protein A2504_07585 [Bdellovibrionales bacterium RIFOXYD12_FULL_39_22]|nr:MAG: hypothetical protein A2385_10910 [Bdellovibrionales bacterium RIFOXYB1_FULL_39_21]OFZ41307.1 MAG: hypothetical protein A2485_00775 [Bdellovibrionales bacterium RIFOXYC12_FULL_39_17]OFZ45043.1 MAG: hypothetical protein A2404_11205 [Bdellovibrionales bacterium RIFOXYC1_FULL_39_130]OFZ74427.1 MAG: hypothetical protein A2560_11240 [Bdellovibrionales bacterium RIFOXYD1_FULL_39_84]OFZ76703.1 MAG: hypothetical protein A2451_04555 [Bdellovibrionales bacterium RIFOXYC2_FULL_39_8]OFZ92439.1 MAG:
MKTSLLIFLATLFSFTAFATVDGQTRVFLVVQDVNSEEFFVERAPIIGCYGLPYGPQLVQFTAEYSAPSNVGCGMHGVVDNINYLTCAKVLNTRESANYMSLVEMTLDISGCEAKNNPQFITMVRTAAKLNFPLKKGEIKLTLVK